MLLVLVTFVWGVTFVEIKDALSDVSPLLFNAVRMTVAAVALLLVFRKHRRMTATALRAGIWMGTLLWLGYEFQTTGLVYTTPSKSAFVTGISVALVPIFLALIWRRHTNGWTLLGVLAAFFGLYLLTVPNSALSSLFASINRGDALTLGCAVTFGFHIIFMGRAMRAHRFEQIATLQACVAAVLMAASVPVLEKPHAIWSARVVIAVLVTALLATAAAFTIQAWAQQFTPPTHTALIFVLEPVFAWASSYVFLGERLGVRAGLGALLILAGVLVSELKGRASQPSEEVGERMEVVSGRETAS
ncbi:MAG TPA: DMT family transporter [Terriglobales bacterium]|nr:DMT family transporter [Terriglobales bacterium]